MDKIIKLIKTADDPIKELPKPSGPAESSHNKTERKDKSLLDKAKQTFGIGAASVTATSCPPADVLSRFFFGDRVVIQTAQEVPVKGWVRWVGPMKMSKKASRITLSIVGIETVSLYNSYYVRIISSINSSGNCIANA